MTAVTYHGHEVLTYPGYIDTVTGQTLTCEPGGDYDILPVNAVTEIPNDGRFSAREITAGDAPDDKRRRVPQAQATGVTQAGEA